MSYPEAIRQWCSIARALDIVGDKWTLLIVREAVKGVSKFTDFQDGLGIAKDVLGARLAVLVDAEILTRQPYRDSASRTRDEYVLTERGHALLTVLAALSGWGLAHLPAEKPPYLSFVEESTGDEVSVQFVTADGRTVPTRDVRATPNPELARA